MGKSQRIGLLLLALICVAILVVTVWRSRAAADRYGYERVDPRDFTTLSIAPPAETERESKTSEESDTVKSGKERKGKDKRHSAGKKKEKGDGGSQRRQKTKSPQPSQRQWLDDL